jgi:hypothetical protein
MSQSSARSLFPQELIEASPAFPGRTALFRQGLEAAPAEGLICELGVGCGDTMVEIAEMIDPRMIYGFDSFEGLPEDWVVASRDWTSGLRKGDFGPSPDARYRIVDPPKSERNMEIVAGWFNESIPRFLAAHPGPAAFLHLDAAIYSATVTALDAFADRMIVGTILQFDEFYNFVGFEEHEHKAWYEFIERTGFSFEFFGHCTPIREGETVDKDRTDRQVAVRVTGL